MVLSLMLLPTDTDWDFRLHMRLAVSYFCVLHILFDLCSDYISEIHFNLRLIFQGAMGSF